MGEDGFLGKRKPIQGDGSRVTNRVWSAFRTSLYSANLDIHVYALKSLGLRSCRWHFSH